MYLTRGGSAPTYRPAPRAKSETRQAGAKPVARTEPSIFKLLFLVVVSMALAAIFVAALGSA
jgi:hypothetical protein